MNWYNDYKKQIQADINWKDIGKGLAGGSILGIPPAALVLWLSQQAGMPTATAEEMIKNQPEAVQELIEQSNTEPITNQTTSNKNSTISVEEMIPIITQNEGKKSIAYNDSRGYRTIGIGFCIDPRVRKDAKQRIESLGLNYQNVYNGKQQLTDQQIYLLAKDDIISAIQIADVFSGGLSNHPKSAQIAMTDMAYALGPKLHKFNNMKKAIISHNYQQAANEMINSKWFEQVKSRGPRMVEMMRQSI